MKNIMKNKKTITLSVIALVVVILLCSSMTTIKSGEVGIRVRLGKVVNTKTNEGINFKIPFIETIEKMNVKVQKVEVNANSSSKDLQVLDEVVAVNYRIDSKKAKSLYKNVGTGYREVILEPAIQESIKSVTSRYTAEELITNRSEVSKKCMEDLNKKMNKYGIIISDFNITNFSFSQEFDKAIEEKQVAEQKVLTAKQELEREKIEAEKKIVAAEAEKKANELKQQSLTDNIIREKFIEKWDGKLPTVMDGNNMLDISKLIK